MGEVRKPRSFKGDEIIGFGDSVLWLKMLGDGREDVGLAFLAAEVYCVCPINCEGRITSSFVAQWNGLGNTAGVSGGGIDREPDVGCSWEPMRDTVGNSSELSGAEASKECWVLLKSNLTAPVSSSWRVPWS